MTTLIDFEHVKYMVGKRADYADWLIHNVYNVYKLDTLSTGLLNNFNRRSRTIYAECEKVRDDNKCIGKLHF